MKNVEYSLHIVPELETLYRSQKTLRPLRVKRYEPGHILNYDLKGLAPAREGGVKLEIDKFIGGGFAGQVYRVKILDTMFPEGQIPGLEPGKFFAMKILIPPSGFARVFRNFIYALGFQGPFSAQVNPDAARAGAIWQRLIRIGAKIRFGSEEAVVNILATFIDPVLGSCGEISEWIEGRNWRFEVDNNLDARKKWKVGDGGEKLGSAEYRAKKTFMVNLVKLLHDMGAYELARQYNWWTCKSQPNALKRLKYDDDPAKGNTAVDFRAGLALLPFLPMSPADFKLIIQGIGRGSLVQFDRGDLKKLNGFIKQNASAFRGMEDVLKELKHLEKSYRSSLPDITHNHIKLLYSGKLWSSIIASSVKSWRIRNLIDEKTEKKLNRKKFPAAIFYLLGLIPFLGKFLRKLFGHKNFRQHYKRLLVSRKYFRKAARAHIAEALIGWLRAGRISEKRTQTLSKHSGRYYVHLPLSFLPPGIHRACSDWRYFRQSLDNIFIRPVRLYFKSAEREQWLRDMVAQGQKNGMLTQDEAANINSKIKEPFIQKYLKSLAVHVCTLPVTQIVSVIVAVVYVKLHPELSWQQASVHAGLILGLFQVTPISPGSLIRGLYVTFLVIRERNFKDYNVAFFLSFFKYIGYLAFPIQMAYRYPDLARFMAGHWATGAVHIVPIFGERGALLEHTVFDMFYNFPLTIQRRMKKRREHRSGLRPRNWQAPLCAIAGVGFLSLVDILYLKLSGHIPAMREIWWIAVWVPGFSAAAVTAWAGGASIGKRISLGAVCGAIVGLLYPFSNTFFKMYLFPVENVSFHLNQFLSQAATIAFWMVFLFTFLAIIGTLIKETRPLKSLF